MEADHSSDATPRLPEAGAGLTRTRCGLARTWRPRRCVSFLRLRWSWLPRRGEQVAGRRTRSWHSLAASPHPPEPGGRWAIGPPSGRGDAPGGGRDRRPRQVRVASRDNEGPVASGSGDGGSTFTLGASLYKRQVDYRALRSELRLFSHSVTARSPPLCPRCRLAASRESDTAYA